MFKLCSQIVCFGIVWALSVVNAHARGSFFGDVPSVRSSGGPDGDPFGSGGRGDDFGGPGPSDDPFGPPSKSGGRSKSSGGGFGGADDFGGPGGSGGDPFGGGGDMGDPFDSGGRGDDFGGPGPSDDPFGSPSKSGGRSKSSGGGFGGADDFGGSGGSGGDPFGGGGDPFGSPTSGHKRKDPFGEDPFSASGPGGFGDEPGFPPLKQKASNAMGMPGFGGPGGGRSLFSGPGPSMAPGAQSPGARTVMLTSQDMTELKSKMNFTSIEQAWDKKGLTGKLSSAGQPGRQTNQSEDELAQQRDNDRKIFFEISSSRDAPPHGVAELEKGIEFLRSQGADVVFSVADPSTDRSPQLLQFLWDRRGNKGPFLTEIDGTSIAVPEGKTHSVKQLDVLSSTIIQHMRKGRHVLINGGDGRDRNGLVIAAVYMRAFKKYNVKFVKDTINDALEKSIHTDKQVKALKEFAEFLKKHDSKASKDDEEDSLTPSEKESADKGSDDHKDTMSDADIEKAAEGTSDD